MYSYTYYYIYIYYLTIPKSLVVSLFIYYLKSIYNILSYYYYHYYQRLGLFPVQDTLLSK